MHLSASRQLMAYARCPILAPIIDRVLRGHKNGRRRGNTGIIERRKRMAAKPKTRMIGRHIVADPAICHSRPLSAERASLLLMYWNRSGQEWPGRALLLNGGNKSPKRLSPKLFGSRARRSMTTQASTSPLNTCCNHCVRDRPRRKHYRRTAAAARGLEHPGSPGRFGCGAQRAEG